MSRTRKSQAMSNEFPFSEVFILLHFPFPSFSMSVQTVPQSPFKYLIHFFRPLVHHDRVTLTLTPLSSLSQFSIPSALSVPYTASACAARPALWVAGMKKCVVVISFQKEVPQK
eukprot:368039_1